MTEYDDLPTDVAALISAHALGALEPEEAGEVERLIAGSDTARRVFEELLETAAAIALAADGGAPPPDLRERILQAARKERDVSEQS
jgi:anti-sigma factor RsiW